MARKHPQMVAIGQLTPRRKAMLNTLSKLYRECDDDDETFLIHALFLIIVDRHGIEEARRLFEYMGKPQFGIDTRHNLLVTLYEHSGLNKAEFSRKFTAAPGAPGVAGVRRDLDRALAKIAKAERKAGLGHSSKKLS